MDIQFIPRSEFVRIEAGAKKKRQMLPLLADMCRLNALSAIMRAGSGHIGASFSALDIVVFLLYEHLNTRVLGWRHADRDIFFSSKGHDVPGYYAVLHALGVLPEQKLLNLRRRDGLPGHPDICVPGVEANSGSLGMGISKARGMAYAKKLNGRKGRVYVMTGDGELQEGQNYEALRNAAQQSLGNLVMIVDQNQVQSDRPVAQISALGDFAAICTSLGWQVMCCNGHDFDALRAAIHDLEKEPQRPKLLIAETIKGRGVSFMEHPYALQENDGLYRWHAGAPDPASYEQAVAELVQRINNALQKIKLAPLALQTVAMPAKTAGSQAPESVAQAFGETVVELAAKRKNIVVLDADLSADCALRRFETTFPLRFVECGISEQDMVSTAGGLALQGKLPIVNSFAAFLASRANEQIYNNATEGKKIIYALHYAGLLPAGPGLSHQSVRDISLFGALPNCLILQPANARQTRAALKYAVLEAKETCALRLQIGPLPREIPAAGELRFGRGEALAEGDHAVLFAYGPVMLNEALRAAELLAGRGITLRIVNMPWLNRVDLEWLYSEISPYAAIFVLEDHSVVGGLGDFLLSQIVANEWLQERRFKKFGLETFPVWGTAEEALRHHGLHGELLADEIATIVRPPRIISAGPETLAPVPALADHSSN